MNMHIFRKYFFFTFLIMFCCLSCQKDELVYDINQLQSSSYNANKNKLKSISQYISIVYANLFQKALSSNELVEITRCIESIGDKEVAHEIVLSNFMNKSDVIIPSDSLMRADLDLFIDCWPLTIIQDSGVLLRYHLQPLLVIVLPWLQLPQRDSRSHHLLTAP